MLTKSESIKNSLNIELLKQPSGSQPGKGGQGHPNPVGPGLEFDVKILDIIFTQLEFMCRSKCWMTPLKKE